MRRGMRSIVASGVLALIVGGGAVPSAFAASDVRQNDTVLSPAAEAFTHRLTAGYQGEPSDTTAEIPSNATSLHVLLPAQAAAFDMARVSYFILSDTQQTHGVLALPLGTTEIDLAVPPGFFAQGASLDGEGRPYFEFWMFGANEDGFPDALPGGDDGPGGSNVLDVSGTVRPTTPAPGAAETSALLDLDETRADFFQYSDWYWADPDAPLWVTRGDTVAVDVPSVSADTVISARIAPLTTDWGAQIPATPLPTSAGDPSSNGLVPVTVSIPSDFDASPYVAHNSTAVMTVTAVSGGSTTNVRIRARVATDVGAVSVTRISGSDRFRGAAFASEALVPHHVDSVYLASGQNFADALSIAPVAAAEGVPVLLGTADEWRLDDTMTIVEGATTAVGARTVVQVGGDAALPPVWRWQLGEAGNGPGFHTDQIAGADRYEVSRAIARRAYGGSGAPVVFIATGRDYADALAAVPSAAAEKAPVVLVDGLAASVGQAARELLADLRTSQVVIVGGRSAVSAAIETELRGLVPAGQVTRYDGPDRFVVAEKLNAAYFPNADSAYLASGTAFPDALTGGVVAAAAGSPLYLARGDCVPGRVLDQFDRSGVTRVTLLGGEAALSSSVAELRRCPS